MEPCETIGWTRGRGREGGKLTMRMRRSRRSVQRLSSASMAAVTSFGRPPMLLDTFSRSLAVMFSFSHSTTTLANTANDFCWFIASSAASRSLCSLSFFACVFATRVCVWGASTAVGGTVTVTVTVTVTAQCGAAQSGATMPRRTRRLENLKMEEHLK
eukprot:1093058-Prorocentrum_minimum.AAC.1